MSAPMSAPSSRRTAASALQALGAGMPKVATWQLDYDATNGVLLAGTHGRGAYTLANRGPSAALVVTKADSGKPVGPGSTIDYAMTVQEHRQRGGHRCQGHRPVPVQHDLRVGRQRRPGHGPHACTWTGLTIPAGGAVTGPLLGADLRHPSGVGHHRSSMTASWCAGRQGVGTTGSPRTTADRARPRRSRVGSRRAEWRCQGRAPRRPTRSSVDNNGLCGRQLRSGGHQHLAGRRPTTRPARLRWRRRRWSPAAARQTVCVKVDVPAGAAEDAEGCRHLTATSTADPTVHGHGDRSRRIAVA